jgi:hypothetical protein
MFFFIEIRCRIHHSPYKGRIRSMRRKVSRRDVDEDNYYDDNNDYDNNN